MGPAKQNSLRAAETDKGKRMSLRGPNVELAASRINRPYLAGLNASCGTQRHTHGPGHHPTPANVRSAVVP